MRVLLACESALSFVERDICSLTVVVADLARRYIQEKVRTQHGLAHVNALNPQNPRVLKTMTPKRRKIFFGTMTQQVESGSASLWFRVSLVSGIFSISPRKAFGCWCFWLSWLPSTAFNKLGYSR